MVTRPTRPTKTTTRKTPAKKTAQAPTRTRTVVKHDWEKAKTVFVEQTEEISLKELSELTGIPYGQVRDRSSKEHWQYLRAEHQTTVQRAVTKGRVKKLLEQATAFDDQSLSAAKLGINLIQGRMMQIGQVFAASKKTFDDTVRRLQLGQPVSREELRSAVYSKEIIDLAAALERFQNVGRKALGIPDVQKFETEVHGSLDHNLIDGEPDLSVGQELRRFDGDRLAAVFDVASRLGLRLNDILGTSDVIDAEEVDEDTDGAATTESGEEAQPALGN